MSPTKQPSLFSIQLAHTAAVGHINAGLELYRAFAALLDKAAAEQRPVDPNRVIELGVPAVTNLALGLELLVKVHHFQAAGAYPHGHDIQKLGGQFPPSALENLRQIYRSLYDDPSADKGLELRCSGGAPGHAFTDWPAVNFSTYETAIAYVGTMYVKWRYIYEEFQEEQVDIRVAFGSLYFLAQTFHRAVRTYVGNTKVSMRGGTSQGL